jgi:hypothetical protein
MLKNYIFESAIKYNLKKKFAQDVWPYKMGYM